MPNTMGDSANKKFKQILTGKITKPSIVKLFKGSHLFKGFSEEDLNILVRFCNVEKFEKEDVIIRQGDDQDNKVYFLLSGKVSVFVDGGFVLTLQDPWAVFGEMRIVSSAPRSATVAADNLTRVLSVDVSRLYEPVFAEDYRLRYNFYKIFSSILSWKLDITSNRAKLYEDALNQMESVKKANKGLEERLDHRLQQIFLFSHVFNSMQESVLITNLSGVVTEYNPSVLVLFMVEPHEVIGTELYEFLTLQEEGISLKEVLKNLPETGFWSGEMVGQRSEEDRFPVHVTLVAVYNQQDELINFAAIVRDISSRKAYEERILEQKQQLEVAYRELQSVDQLKDDFITLVSHELRTPLTTVLSYSEMMAMEGMVEPEEVPIYAESIHTEAQRLHDMINRVLDFSKLEQGKMHFDFQTSDLNEVVQKAYEDIKSKMSDKGLEFELSVPEGKVTLLCDEKRIRQCLDYLLENALQFTNHGKVNLALTDHADSVRILVKDTGVGILEENLTKVFNKFEAVEDMRLHHKGLGLGMPITSLIVQGHHGKIEVQSVLDQGSEFSVCLPKTQPASDQSETTPEDSSSTTPLCH